VRHPNGNAIGQTNEWLDCTGLISDPSPILNLRKRYELLDTFKSPRRSQMKPMEFENRAIEACDAFGFTTIWQKELALLACPTTENPTTLRLVPTESVEIGQEVHFCAELLIFLAVFSVIDDDTSIDPQCEDLIANARIESFHAAHAAGRRTS
jgi:hypothetical protein